MTQWIELEDGRRWEVVPVSRLSNFQMARACHEIGMSPEAIDEALSTPGHPDSLLAFTVAIFAARLAAGERGLRTVEQANSDIPYGQWDIVDDEDAEAEPETDPTAAPAETVGA